MKKIGVVGVPGSWSSEQLADKVAEKTGFRCLIDMGKVHFDILNGQVMFKDINLMEFDALIIKKIGRRYGPKLFDRLSILDYLYRNKIKIFSKPSSIRRIINRLSCTLELEARNLPIVDTIICNEINDAVKAVQKFQKAVFKPIYTSKARGMIVVEDNAHVADQIRAYKDAGNSTMYIQKFINIPGKDLGLSFLGGKYLGTYARVANKNSWNTSTESGGKYSAYTPSKDVIKIAKKAQKDLDLAFTCVDIVETEEGPKIFEVSAFGGFKGLEKACGLDVADLYTDFVLEKI
jgi:ribosomal protein S6--L-glutamate ligase